MMHFVSHVFDVRAEGVRLIAMEEVRNDGRFVYIKNILEMAGGRMHILILANLPAIIYKNHHKSLPYYIYLAPLILFFFTKRRSQTRGAWHNGPPKYAVVSTVSL